MKLDSLTIFIIIDGLLFYVLAGILFTRQLAATCPWFKTRAEHDHSWLIASAATWPALFLFLITWRAIEPLIEFLTQSREEDWPGSSIADLQKMQRAANPQEEIPTRWKNIHDPTKTIDLYHQWYMACPKCKAEQRLNLYLFQPYQEQKNRLTCSLCGHVLSHGGQLAAMSQGKWLLSNKPLSADEHQWQIS